VVLPRQQGHKYEVDHRDGLLYLRTNRDAKNFRLVTAPVSEPTRWTEVIPHRPDVLLEAIELFAGHLVVQEQREALTRMRIQDFATQVPGFSIETVGKTGVRLILRGQNTGGAGASVATMVDDVVLNDATANSNGSTVTPNFETFDLERIEVLKGPQGTLFGRNTTGDNNTSRLRASFSGQLKFSHDLP
jgi:hypothetical protein